MMISELHGVLISQKLLSRVPPMPVVLVVRSCTSTRLLAAALTRSPPAPRRQSCFEWLYDTDGSADGAEGAPAGLLVSHRLPVDVFSERGARSAGRDGILTAL